MQLVVVWLLIIGFSNIAYVHYFTLHNYLKFYAAYPNKKKTIKKRKS